MKKHVLLVFLLFIINIECFSQVMDIENNMVRIEGGEFLLGREGTTPHLVRVKLNDFYISRYETTVEQWEVFLEETGIEYLWEDEYTNIRIECPYPDSPISVHWRQAVAFTNWISRKYGLEECYIINGDDVEWKRASDGFRLPTDAEWEFAARGGLLSEGYEYSGSDCLDEVAWTGWNSGGHAHPVGTKKPNELGLYDMSGNANEWCWDLSSKYPNNPSILLTNPVGPTLAEYLKFNERRYRISRGGSALNFERIFFTTRDRNGGLFEFGLGAGGQGIRLARNAD